MRSHAREDERGNERYGTIGQSFVDSRLGHLWLFPRSTRDSCRLPLHKSCDNRVCEFTYDTTAYTWVESDRNGGQEYPCRTSTSRPKMMGKDQVCHASQPMTFHRIILPCCPPDSPSTQHLSSRRISGSALVYLQEATANGPQAADSKPQEVATLAASLSPVSYFLEPTSQLESRSTRNMGNLKSLSARDLTTTMNCELHNLAEGHTCQSLETLVKHNGE